MRETYESNEPIFREIVSNFRRPKIQHWAFAALLAIMGSLCLIVCVAAKGALCNVIVVKALSSANGFA